MSPCPPAAPRPLAAAALCLSLAACASTPRPAPSAGWQRPLAAVAPSLEEIFLIPGLHGVPPRLHSLSADGKLALVDWRPLQLDANGQRRLGTDLGPHWLATSAGVRALDESTSLPRLLERTLDAQEGGEPRLRATAWSPTGHRLALAWRSSIVLVDWTDAGEPRAHVLYRDPPEGALDERSEPLPRLGSITSLAFLELGAQLEVRAGGEIRQFSLERLSPVSLGASRCITEALAANVSRVEFSEDRARAFSREGKLVADPAREGEHFHDFESGRGVALEGLENSKRIEGLDLSPCGSFVFGCELEGEKRNKPTLIPDYLTERVTTRSARSELADDPWQERRLYVWSTADGRRRELELPGERRTPTSAIGWAPCGPPRFAFRRTLGDYRCVETWIWSESGLRLALVERDERWVGGPGAFARWSVDGTRILLASEGAPFSTTPGRNQLFELDPLTGALRQLTEVEGEVSSWNVAGDGKLIVCASRTDPARRALGVVEPLGVRWLAAPEGVNSTMRSSADGTTLVFEHESLGVPAELWSVRLDGTQPAARLTDTLPPLYRARDWILPEKLSVSSCDGELVRAHVYSPRGATLERPRAPAPCVVFIHGAGYLQNVTDSMTEYAVNLMFHSRLAEQGYVVVDVDYRGSAGYGAKFRGDVQFQLGKLELADIAAVVDELARRRAIDPERVACYGGSYGGFLTLMALFQEPQRWVGGAALRSVTDWRTYHPGYTQPRLGRPSTHPDAYAASSPLDHAHKLRDPLLILHGMVDSNVFAQDSIRLMEKLIDLGLDFDAMLYPSQDHGFEDGMHWLDEYRRIERFLVNCLAPQ
ncbi:MAG: S9 family peptidase [Planctomycetes bacterium]|nr:S9 family peptidase [Planctomycetota bacterium]